MSQYIGTSGKKGCGCTGCGSHAYADVARAWSSVKSGTAHPIGCLGHDGLSGFDSPKTLVMVGVIGLALYILTRGASR